MEIWSIQRILVVISVALGLAWVESKAGAGEPANSPKGARSYLASVQECLDVLIEHGTDRYGPTQRPILVSILDIETRQCPPDPLPLDEPFRLTRRGRRNPGGANLLTDQPLIKALFLVTAATGQEKYGNFGREYMAHYLKHLVDDKGLFWWGWHRHYDVYADQMTGHQGLFHEIHAIHAIAWDRLWEVNPEAVRRQIKALWQWHVVDKTTGEINRHADGQRGCDFSMSAGACIEAFAFLHSKTKENLWLDRAKLLADYYWHRRHPQTNLFPDRPNAGTDRFDGTSFVSSITGLHCHSLLRAFEWTAEPRFKQYAVAYLKAYGHYGFDEATGQFWGAFRLDGQPIPGPRIDPEKVAPSLAYAAYEPRGYLDLWQPYAAGYEHALATAQAYAYAYQLSAEEALLTTAKRFAALIQRNPPGGDPPPGAWYRSYSITAGRQGPHAEHYGRAISFYLHLYVVTGDSQYLNLARSFADEAVQKLFYKGLFRGHPAKPYYEAMDGVGYLLYALCQLDSCLGAPQAVVGQKAIDLGQGTRTARIVWDNW